MKTKAWPVIGVLLLCAGAPAATDEHARAGLLVGVDDNDIPILEKWVDAFRHRRPGVEIRIERIGSSPRAELLVDARFDLLVFRERMPNSELASASTSGVLLQETLVAVKGETVLVNRSNPVVFLSFAELRSIFTGRIVSWSAVGGPNQPIQVVVKKDGRSRRIFQTEVLKGDPIVATAILVEDKDFVPPEVARRPWAIGFTSLGSVLPVIDKVQLLRLGSGDSDETTTYAVAQPLLFVVRADAEAQVRAFRDFVLSEAAQSMLGTKYAPVTNARATFEAME